jgi:hypothetical protein
MPSQVTNMPGQPTVACPKCGTRVPLTEALAAPLIEATRVEYENKLRVQNEAFARQEDELALKERSAAEITRQLETREAELNQKSAEARVEIETQRTRIAAEVARQTESAVAIQLAERVAIEKKTIVEAEERRASQRFADQLAERDRDQKEQSERIEQLTERLTKAQNAEAELKRRERELEDRERESSLKVEQEINDRLDQVRLAASNEAEQRLSLQLNDRDRTIRDLASKLEDASRKA